MTTIFVAGIPAPQGSAKGFVVGKRAIVTHDNKRTMPWRSQVTEALQAHFTECLREPFAVTMAFVMPRPASLPKTKPAPPHTKKPDLDKLTRAVLDAGTGIVWADDACVVELHASKRYAAIGEQCGLYLRIEWAG